MQSVAGIYWSGGRGPGDELGNKVKERANTEPETGSDRGGKALMAKQVERWRLKVLLSHRC